MLEQGLDSRDIREGLLNMVGNTLETINSTDGIILD